MKWTLHCNKRQVHLTGKKFHAATASLLLARTACGPRAETGIRGEPLVLAGSMITGTGSRCSKLCPAREMETGRPAKFARAANSRCALLPSAPPPSPDAGAGAGAGAWPLPGVSAPIELTPSPPSTTRPRFFVAPPSSRGGGIGRRLARGLRFGVDLASREGPSVPRDVGEDLPPSVSATDPAPTTARVRSSYSLWLLACCWLAQQ